MRGRDNKDDNGGKGEGGGGEQCPSVKGLIGWVETQVKESRFSNMDTTMALA